MPKPNQIKNILLLHERVFSAQLECLENISRNTSTAEDVKAVIKLSKFIKESFDTFNDWLFTVSNSETQEPPSK